MKSSGSESKASSLRVLRAALALPGVVAIAVPVLLVWLYGADVGWGLPTAAAAAVVLVGVALVLLGLRLWLETVRLFAAIGRGTLAPWDPTRRLVVNGPYQRVRNPMISAVAAVLLGDALVLGSIAVLIEFAVFALMNVTFIPLFEEPDLMRRFGGEYEEYRRAVPRWIPRHDPWTPGR